MPDAAGLNATVLTLSIGDLAVFVQVVVAIVVLFYVPYSWLCGRDSSKADGREGHNGQGADEHRCILAAVQVWAA
jgi:hypothetical protein